MNTPSQNNTKFQPAPRKPGLPAEYIDPLLKIREEFTRWIDPEIQKSRDNQNQCLINYRHDMADTYKAEAQALEDCRHVVLKMIDGELKEIVMQKKGN